MLKLIVHCKSCWSILSTFAQHWVKYQQSKLFGQFDPTMGQSLTKHWAIIYPIAHQKSVSWANFM